MKSLTHDQLVQYFGDYTKYLRTDGTIGVDWELEILTTIDLPSALPLSFNPRVKVSRISCHKLIAPHLHLALIQCHSNPEIWDTINDYGGCYNFRIKRGKGSKSLSAHCWGAAIDLDVKDNPFGTTTTKVHPKMIEIFKSNGFMWGGYFPPKYRDGMHFEFIDIGRLTNG